MIATDSATHKAWHFAAVAARLRRTTDMELAVTRELAARQGPGSPLAELERQIRSSVQWILDLLLSGAIDPDVPLRLSCRDSIPADRRVSDRALRIGVFPTAGNPPHWLHFLGALETMRRLRLDKVVFLIAGRDHRKPHLLDTDERHRMARRALRTFSPVLEYSPLGRDTDLPGELNLFRLMSLNPEPELHAVYVAGTDHFRRRHPGSGTADTIELLESAIRRRAYGFDPRRQRVSVAFLDRGDCPPPTPTDLLVQRISGLPPGVSSTKIRDALGGKCAVDMLGALPLSVLNQIRLRHLYCPFLEDSGLECVGHLGDDIEACRRFLDETARHARRSRIEWPTGGALEPAGRPVRT